MFTVFSHSKEYRERYQANLTKGLPRIPFASDFKAFERAGRKLADIHLNYENQSSPRNVEIWRDGKKVRLDKLSAEDLRVEKIRENKRDRSEIFFNQRVALKSIPKEVWDYKIGEWSAVKHVIERYRYKVDKDSRIVNDPNSYSDDPPLCSQPSSECYKCFP